MDTRCILTPHIIACEIAMVMNQQRPGIVRQGDADVRVEFMPRVDDDDWYLSVGIGEANFKSGPFPRDEMFLAIDEFSERFVHPLVEIILGEYYLAKLDAFDTLYVAKN
jgi:hypothetical protein